MSTHTDSTPTTKRNSYKAIKNAAEYASLRRRVAAALARESATTSGLSDRFPERSSNAIRPRVNELLRMGCVKRDGKRTNPSGHEAYVHHITERGERYLAGECDPEPEPTLSELQAQVVTVARSVCAGEMDENRLREAIREHDGAKLRRDPEWQPPHLLESDDALSQEELERIENDPVLDVADFVGGDDGE